MWHSEESLGVRVCYNTTTETTAATTTTVVCRRAEQYCAGLFDERFQMLMFLILCIIYFNFSSPALRYPWTSRTITTYTQQNNIIHMCIYKLLIIVFEQVAFCSFDNEKNEIGIIST